MLKIWIKLVLGILLGSIISIFITDLTGSAGKFVEFIAQISLNLLLYFTVIYIAVKVYTGIISMKNTKVKIWKVVGFFLACVLFSLIITSIISMFIMNIGMLQPENGFHLEQKQAIKFDLYTYSDLIEGMISQNALTAITSPMKFLLPIIFLAAVLAIGTASSGKKGVFFYDIVKSFGDILEVIVQQFVEVFSIGSLFIVIVLLGTNRELLGQSISIVRPLVSIVIVSAFVFLILSVLLRFIFKENVFHYYTGLLGAALTGLITGNTASTVIPLSLHLKRNINIDDDTADLLVPLGTVFNNTGTVIVSTVILMTIIIGYSPNILTLQLQVLIFVLMVLFSLRLDGVNELGFMVLLAMMLKEPSFHFEENSYLLFIGIAPFLSRIAIFINVFTTGIFIMLTGKYMGGQKKVEYRDFI